jgi:hypothetical protein
MSLIKNIRTCHILKEFIIYLYIMAFPAFLWQYINKYFYLPLLDQDPW